MRTTNVASALDIGAVIVLTLRKFGPLPVDYLATVISRNSAETREYLDGLADEGVVELDGDTVSLSSSTTPERRETAH